MADFAAKSIFSTKQRTNVLYDFSIVKKARFYVFTIDAEWNKYTYDNEILYVQVNPAQMSVAVKSNRVYNANHKFEANTQVKMKKDISFSEDKLNITLYYDLYDEYMVGTADGLLDKTSLTGSRDLTGENTTSMQKLIKYSRCQNKALLFKWGPIQYFGIPENVDFTYTAFSRFGNPLKADGSITLARTGQTLGTNGDYKDYAESGADIFGMSEDGKLYKGIIDTQELKENALLLAEIGATQALR